MAKRKNKNKGYFLDDDNDHMEDRSSKKYGSRIGRYNSRWDDDDDDDYGYSNWWNKNERNGQPYYSRTTEKPLIMSEKIEVVFSDTALAKINTMRKLYTSIEWSGILYMKHLEGIITEGNAKYEVVDIIIQDVGSSGFTDFELQGPITEYAQKKGIVLTNPTTLDKEHFLGKLHSHHHMSVFFSGEDDHDLYRGARSHDVYFSLIVNNWEAGKENVIGKMAARGTRTTSFEFTDHNADPLNVQNVTQEGTIEYDLTLSIDATPEDVPGFEDAIKRDFKPNSAFGGSSSNSGFLSSRSSLYGGIDVDDEDVREVNMNYGKNVISERSMISIVRPEHMITALCTRDAKEYEELLKLRAPSVDLVFHTVMSSYFKNIMMNYLLPTVDNKDLLHTLSMVGNSPAGVKEESRVFMYSSAQEITEYVKQTNQHPLDYFKEIDFEELFNLYAYFFFGDPVIEKGIKENSSEVSTLLENKEFFINVLADDFERKFTEFFKITDAIFCQGLSLQAKKEFVKEVQEMFTEALKNWKIAQAAEVTAE